MRNLLRLALILICSGWASTTAADTTSARHTRAQLALGIGAGFPDFEAEDGVKTGFAIMTRLSVFPASQSSFGGWIDFSAIVFGGDKRYETVVLPNLTATGDHSIERTSLSIHLGGEFIPAVRRDNRIRPRLALGGGVAFFNATEQIEIAGITEDQPIPLRDKETVVPELVASIGLLLPQPRGINATLSLEFNWHYGGRVRMQPYGDQDERTLSAFTLVLTYMWSSPPPRQPESGAPVVCR